MDLVAALTLYQYIFPLVYLILNRHLEIISIAQIHVISKDELYDAHDTLLYIGDAASSRLEHMRSKFLVPAYFSKTYANPDIFEQNRLDVKLQLKTFARGLVSLLKSNQLSQLMTKSSSRK